MAGGVFSDVEGTLIRGSLPTMFIKTGYRLGMFSRRQLIWAALINTLAKPFPAYGRINNALRYGALKSLMKGRSVEQVQRVVEAVLPQLTAALKPLPLDHLRRCQAEGMPLVLVSSSLTTAIEALAQELGGRAEGTYMEIQNGSYTGRGGKPCQGPEKARRVRAVAAELGLDLKASVGYGDTLTDLDFLTIVGQAIVVDPDPTLRAEAVRRGWEILST